MLNNLAFGIMTGIILISLVILFSVLLGKLYIHKIKNYTRVIYQKDLDFQKALNTTILETQEQVLNNISQDLHDDAGQQLTAINFQLENLKLDSPELQAVLAPISESVGGLAKSIRSISHSLNNQLLTRQDLFKAIAVEAERLRKNIDFNITVSIDEENKINFNPNEKIVIYRIFQEIVNNILKHARARKILITLDTKNGFVMTISDDGRGFDYEGTMKNKATIGLHNMIGRAAIINYNLTIDSAPDQGTTITLSANQA
jgi:signal transduction histidine kinase